MHNLRILHGLDNPCLSDDLAFPKEESLDCPKNGDGLLGREKCDSNPASLTRLKHHALD